MTGGESCRHGSWAHCRHGNSDTFWLCLKAVLALLTTTNPSISLLSTGPSTKLLHSLYSKISQYTELTNHNMRFNAFIFGLLK